MSDIEVLKQDSLFYAPDFLDSECCFELRSEIDAAKQFLTPLIDVEKRIERSDPIVGRANAVFDISQSCQRKLERSIDAVKPEIEKFFSLDLGRQKTPYYVVYKTGDFLEHHIDRAGPTEPDADKRSRIVSIVIFLNDQDDNVSSNGYTGGELTLFGLIDNREFENYGYPIKGEAGKLVAFREDCLHEVTKVTSGRRYIVNSGFYRSTVRDN